MNRRWAASLTATLACLVTLVGCGGEGEKPLTQVFIAGLVIPG